MKFVSKIPGTLAKGLRSLSTHADKIKPGEILRAGAQKLEAATPESYGIRLAELKALEAKVAGLATATITPPPAFSVPPTEE